jgi:hypothetical protein
MTLSLVPTGSTVWKNELLNTWIADIRDVYDYYFNDEGSGVSGSGFSISASGYMPLESRLGGDLNLNNNKVFKVTVDTPVYLAGNIEDTYNGEVWYDGWLNGRFRYGSIFWRSRRMQAFGQNLPLGERKPTISMQNDLEHHI